MTAAASHPQARARHMGRRVRPSAKTPLQAGDKCRATDMQVVAEETGF